MKNNIRELLDKTDINVLDEINILEYIDELEQTKEEYIKSLDKLDVLEARIDKAIDFINAWKDNETDLKVSMLDLLQIEDILRGNDNEDK